MQWKLANYRPSMNADSTRHSKVEALLLSRECGNGFAAACKFITIAKDIAYHSAGYQIS